MRDPYGAQWKEIGIILAILVILPPGGLAVAYVLVNTTGITIWDIIGNTGLNISFAMFAAAAIAGGLIKILTDQRWSRGRNK